jgi:hypothetical protein
MAFNPFQRFRKHQKTFFAVMLIVCMFVFILQFGAGDIFSRGMQWFGSYRERGTYLVSLHGTSIYSGDVARLERQRTLASDFLGIIRGNCQQKAQTEDFAILDKIEGIDRQMKIRGLSDNQRFRDLSARLDRQPEQRTQMLNLYRQIFPNFRYIGPDQQLASIGADIRTVESLLQTPGLKTEEMRALGDQICILQTEAWSRDPSRPRDEYYFGGTKKTEDLLDFWLWRYQADRLGIQLTEADVIKAIAAEFNGRPISDDLLKANKSFVNNDLVRAFLSSHQHNRGVHPMTPPELLSALTDEFRVVMAQEALLGAEPGIRAYRGAAVGISHIDHSPSAPTPDQFLDYFRRNQTRLSVAILPLAVERFVSEVKGAPNEEDLKQLFKKYRDQEPSPDRDRPGFKTPRKVRVQYVSGNADLPYYQQAGQVMAVHPGLLRVLMPATLRVPTVGGVGPAWGATALWPLFMRDAIEEEYKTYKIIQNQEPWLDQYFYRGVHEVSVLRPGTIGLAIGQVLINAGLNTGPFPTSISAGASLIGGATIYEERPRRNMLEAHLLALTAIPSPPGALGVSGALRILPWMPDVVDRKTLEGTFFQREVKEQLAPALVRQNLATFEKELRERKRKPEEAAKHVETAIKQFGLESRFRSMKEPRDRYSLGGDPEMQPFRAAFDLATLGRAGKLDFADMFFVTTGTFEPQRWPGFPETYIYWRVEDIKAREPGNLAEVRGQVEAAWRFLEARGQARKRAQGILEALHKLPENKRVDSRDQLVRWLRDYKEEKKLEGINPDDVFELNDVSRLVDARLQPLARGKTYQLYQPPESRIAYPRPNFADQLLQHLQQRGDTVLLSDMPEQYFYVAVLQLRSSPTLEEFASVYANSGTPFGNPLWRDALLVDFADQYRHRFLYQMRLDAAGPDKIDLDGRLKLPVQEEREERRAPMPFEDF